MGGVQQSVGFRLGVAAAAGLLAFAAGSSALVHVYRGKQPELLAKLHLEEGQALRARYDLALTRDGGSSLSRNVPAGGWLPTLREALRDQPLTPGLLRQFALASSQANGAVDQRKLFQLSEQISRRDLATETWLIEDAVSRDNIGEVLQHYDRALSVRPRAGEALFPVLVGAVSDPSIRGALAPYLRADRPWAASFLQAFSSTVSDYPAAVDLFLRYGGSRAVPAHRPYETALLARLAGTANWSAGQMLARQMAGFDVANPASFGMSKATINPDLAPFIWSIGTEQATDADFVEGEGLTATIPPGERGIAASRTVVVQPGAWHLGYTIDYGSLQPMADAKWQIYCLTATSKDRIAEFAIPHVVGRHAYRSSFDVPAQCGGIAIDLRLQGETSVEDAAITLAAVALSRG